MEVTLQSFKKRFTYDPAKDLLGKGGFGEVYKAYDNEDHIYVALKISQGTTDDKYNLVNEVKRFKKLNHPNIVKHIEAYEVNTGSTDIHGKPILYHVGILEYADHGTLADLLKKGKPDYRLIEDLATDIIEGLAYLHKENIIHRDLKPTNILLFSEGEKLRAKITDFGIAKHTDATAASTQLVGTVEYMAPEFFTTGNITPASDMWSLGVMLMEALTGVHPFGKTSEGISNEQIINNILNKDLSEDFRSFQNFGSLSAPLKQIITKCLLHEQHLRPQTSEEIKVELNPTAQNDFSDKTVVIGKKGSKEVTLAQEPKWKRWGKALFDFDVSNGKWKLVIAKEIIVIIAALILCTITLGLFKIIQKVKVNRIESNSFELHQKIDSLAVNAHPIVNLYYRLYSMGYEESFDVFRSQMRSKSNALELYKSLYPQSNIDEDFNWNKFVITLSISKNFRLTKDEITFEIFFQKLNKPNDVAIGDKLIGDAAWVGEPDGLKQILKLAKKEKQLNDSIGLVYCPSFVEILSLYFVIIFPMRYLLAMIYWAFKVLGNI